MRCIDTVCSVCVLVPGCHSTHGSEKYSLLFWRIPGIILCGYRCLNTSPNLPLGCGLCHPQWHVSPPFLARCRKCCRYHQGRHPLILPCLQSGFAIVRLQAQPLPVARKCFSALRQIGGFGFYPVGYYGGYCDVYVYDYIVYSLL